MQTEMVPVSPDWSDDDEEKSVVGVKGFQV